LALLARIANFILSCPTSLTFQAKTGSFGVHFDPFPCKGCHETTCKGCHETEQTSHCPTSGLSPGRPKVRTASSPRSSN
jgi:hypothetical protein